MSVDADKHHFATRVIHGGQQPDPLTGAVMPPLVILVISVLFIRTGFAWTLRGALGQEALWWSFPAGSAASLLLAVAYYRFGGWRTMHMIDDRPAAGEPPDTGLGVPRQRAGLAPDRSEAHVP